MSLRTRSNLSGLRLNTIECLRIRNEIKRAELPARLTHIEKGENND
jgi:hypothetical protein